MARSHPDPRDPGKGLDVRGMFSDIAPRYDFLNRTLSFGRDLQWRRAMLGRLPPLVAGDSALDLCTGTGDVARALAVRCGADVRVIGADFCEAMVVHALKKVDGGDPPARFLLADALALPFMKDHFKAVTIAFGLRNVEDTNGALLELKRVISPGGRLLVLEFSRPPKGPFAFLYRFYLFHILPVVGRWLSGTETDAYGYLPESVWAWPMPKELRGMMEGAGFTVVEQRKFLMGAVVLHVAEVAR